MKARRREVEEEEEEEEERGRMSSPEPDEQDKDQEDEPEEEDLEAKSGGDSGRGTITRGKVLEKEKWKLPIKRPMGNGRLGKEEVPERKERARTVSPDKEQKCLQEEVIAERRAIRGIMERVEAELMRRGHEEERPGKKRLVLQHKRVAWDSARRSDRFEDLRPSYIANQEQGGAHVWRRFNNTR